MKDLELLNLMIKDGETWISSAQISEIAGKLHKNVMRDIRETLKRLSMLSRFEPHTNEIQSYLETFTVLYDKRYVNGRVEDIMWLNRSLATEVLMSYSLEVRVNVQFLFWKVSDKLKEVGYKHENINELNKNMDNLFEVIKNNADLSVEAYLNQDKYDVDKIDIPTPYVHNLIVKGLEPIKPVLKKIQGSDLDDDFLLGRILDSTIREYIDSNLDKEFLKEVKEKDIIKK